MESARAISRSTAPGSSGLGNDTVGNAGSGSAWSGTTPGVGKPARAKAAVSTAAPTPCSGVYATVRSRGPSGSITAVARSTYEATRSSPST